MTGGDVHGGEMDRPHDFDDDATEALLGGSGRDLDPELADLLADVRVAYASNPPVVGAELAALMGTTPPAAGLAHRRSHMRSRLAAKFAAATVAVVAATSGLAIAGALPAPVQDVLSFGTSDAGSNSDDTGAPADDATTTTTVDDDTTTTTTVDDTSTTTTTTVDDDDTTTTTVAGEPKNHGEEVSAVARDKSLKGCEHGRAVSAIASGTTNDKPCPTKGNGNGDGTTTDGADDDNPGSGKAKGTANGKAKGHQNGKGKGHEKATGNGHAND